MFVTNDGDVLCAEFRSAPREAGAPRVILYCTHGLSHRRASVIAMFICRPSWWRASSATALRLDHGQFPRVQRLAGGCSLEAVPALPAGVLTLFYLDRRCGTRWLTDEEKVVAGECRGRRAPGRCRPGLDACEPRCG